MKENFSNIKEKEWVKSLNEDITNSCVVQLDQVTSNDAKWSESKIIQNDFNKEYNEDKIEKKSELSLLDYESEVTFKTIEKNIVRCNECQGSFFGRPKLITHIRSVHMQYKCEPCGKKIYKTRNVKETQP